mmetsp:Transcript_3440/g.5726  ORF Transcript_3440/g.5726 Transcript_3440/m.5726 type:complete len:193 (-) Transcript_3440:452-1030(-)
METSDSNRDTPSSREIKDIEAGNGGSRTLAVAFASAMAVEPHVWTPRDDDNDGPTGRRLPLLETVSSIRGTSHPSDDVPLPTIQTSDDRDDRIGIQFYDGYGSHQDACRTSPRFTYDNNMDPSSPTSRPSSSFDAFHDWYGSCFPCLRPYEPPETSQDQPNLRDMIDDLLDHESPPKPKGKMYPNQYQQKGI